MACFKINYWFEWKGPCLWAENDEACDTFANGVSAIVDASRLPLSDTTIQRMDEIRDWHDTSLNWEYPPDPGPWRQDECDRFNQAAFELYKQIQKELGPEFEVINCQELVLEDPDLDEYLKDPKNFSRKK